MRRSWSGRSTIIPKAHGRVALEMGHRRVLTGDSHDLFGDGSCELFHTPATPAATSPCG
jgi:hypothetical protein